MDAAGWPAETRGMFLAMQFKAQQQGYRHAFSGAAFQIILRNGQAVGRVVIDRTRAEIRLVDLALLPEHCHAGIGTTVLKELIREAAAGNLPLCLKVLSGNPAVRLYQRLGFTRMGESGLHMEMEWRAGGHANAK